MHKSLFVILWIMLCSHVQAGAPLNGVYRIGTAPSEFTNLSDAVSELNTNGISGPVEFRLKSGTFDEQVTITNFNRTGAADDVVMIRKNGPLDNVTWQHSAASAGSNWVLKLDGAEHVTIRGLTFETTNANYDDVLILEGNTANITVENTTFNGNIASGTLILQNGIGDHPDHQFLNNTFSLGSVAIDFDYAFGGSNSSGLVISGNTFNSQGSKAIETGSSGAVITDNQLFAGTLSGSGYIGMDLDDNGAVVENNDIEMTNGDTAIWMFGAGGQGIESRIVNNILDLRYTSAPRGVYVATANVSVYHNTIRSTSPTEIMLDIGSGAEDVRVINNLLQNVAGAIAYRVSVASDISASEHNVIHTTGGQLASWDGVSYANLSSLQLASGLDQLSVSKAVTFVDVSGPNDLHLAPPSDTDPDLVSPLLPDVGIDFDGDTRGPFTTFKGADEGVPLPPLNNADTTGGFYTIGGTSPDYLTPDQAIDDLKRRGMAGPVTFRVRAGQYSVHETLSGVVRYSDPNDLLYFRPANINNIPEFVHAAVGAADNWILKLEDARATRIQYINFTANGAGTYGRLIELAGSNTGIEFLNCAFTGINGADTDAGALIFSDDTGQSLLTFENNVFTHGDTALYLAPPAFQQPQGESLMINDNLMINQQRYGVYTDHDDAVMNRNQITSGVNDFTGIYVQFNKNTQLNANRMALGGSGTTGIEFNGADGNSFNNPSVISNHMIVASTGIELNTQASLIHFLHNSIAGRDRAISIPDGGGGLELLNNILVNTSSGPALYVSQAADVDVSDHNNLLNVSGALVHWDGVDHADLVAHQLASGVDGSSVSQAVTFNNINTADLHLTGPSDGDVLLAGTPLAEVPLDFDAQVRSISSPYMGADEAATELILTYTVGGQVNGLLTGEELVVQNNLGDDLLLTASGPFQFAQALPDGDGYAVTVLSAPDSPIQNCQVSQGVGVINGQSITDVQVDCDNLDLIFRSDFDEPVTPRLPEQQVFHTTVAEGAASQSGHPISPQGSQTVAVPVGDQQGRVLLVLLLMLALMHSGRLRRT